MTDLNAVLVFAKVVDSGSFTAAAAHLGLPKATVSRKVSDLERDLGARLLQRTTRSLSLTDVGRAFYEHASRVAAELDAATLVVSDLHAAPRGTVRATAPVGLDFLGPVCATFLDRFPDVRLEMTCTDRVVDVVDEGFDLALRTGNLGNSSLVARRLTHWRGVVIAHPDYLRRRGEPVTPEDLATHDCVAFAPATRRVPWTFEHVAGRRSATVAVEPRLACNDLGMVEDAVRAARGVALLPGFRCAAQVERGDLRRILADWWGPEVPLHAVYPSRRHLSPAVRAFVDHLTEALKESPWHGLR